MKPINDTQSPVPASPVDLIPDVNRTQDRLFDALRTENTMNPNSDLANLLRGTLRGLSSLERQIKRPTP